VPVRVSGASVTEIELPDGIKIRVPAGDVDVLKAVILAGHNACREVVSC
jgi:hypothetical protein